MTDLQMIELVVWLGFGYLMTGVALNFSDYVVARYHRRLNKSDSPPPKRR